MGRRAALLGLGGHSLAARLALGGLARRPIGPVHTPLHRLQRLSAASTASNLMTNAWREMAAQLRTLAATDNVDSRKTVE